MSTFQKIIIVGYLGEDPKIHNFDNGGMIANLSIATTENWKDKNTQEKKSRTEWHRVIFNDNQAKIIQKYSKKGDKLLIEGKLKTRKYQVDGLDRFVTEIVGDRFNFMSSKTNDQSSSNNTNNPNQNFPDDHDDLPF